VVEDIGEPFGGIDVVDFAGAQQEVDDGGTLGGFVISAEQVVFPTLCWHQIYVGITNQGGDNQNYSIILHNIINVHILVVRNYH